MDLQARKAAFIQDFIRLQSENAIFQFEKLLKKESKKNLTQFEPMTVEQMKNRINQSIKDSENGKLTSHESLLLEIEKWN
ncbi:MAG: hypothetical protein V4683_06010 [Bacteroidota bacterium]